MPATSSPTRAGTCMHGPNNYTEHARNPHPAFVWVNTAYWRRQRVLYTQPSASDRACGAYGWKLHLCLKIPWAKTQSICPRAISPPRFCPRRKSAAASVSKWVHWDTLKGGGGILTTRVCSGATRERGPVRDPERRRAHTHKKPSADA
jgi:hypothetical protein